MVRCSSAAAKYFEATDKNVQLLYITLSLPKRLDEVVDIASNALAVVDEEANGDSSSSADHPSHMDRMIAVLQELSEMLLAREVDSFQTYLVDVIRMVLRAQPEILASSERRIAVKELLEMESVDEIIHDFIERKVTNLSYSGFGEIEGWCAKRGIPLTISDEQRKQVVDLVATRNIIVHNRGLVDERYLRAVPDSRLAVGERRSLMKPELMTRALKFIPPMVRSIDKGLMEKFNLGTVDCSAKAAIMDVTEADLSKI